MRRLVLSAGSIRELRRFRLRHSDLNDRLDRVLIQLQEDMYHPSLRAHKLQGDLRYLWACSVTHEYRLLFELIANLDSEDNEEDIHLIATGSHDEIY